MSGWVELYDNKAGINISVKPEDVREVHADPDHHGGKSKVRLIDNRWITTTDTSTEVKRKVKEALIWEDK